MAGCCAVPTFPRRSAVTFCREWWRHPEAYLRLDALWKSWEFMRRKPGTGMACGCVTTAITTWVC